MKTIARYIAETCEIWFQELKYILLDKGMILFLSVLPLAYPVIYSWVYNNEVVREVPVVVVDNSHSALSRKFIQMYDASPDVRVACYSGSIKEAEALIGHQEAYGILYFPSDFSKKINRMEQATIGVYCDMSLMLAYKNIYSTAVTISGLMGAGIQTKLLGNYTHHEDVVSAQPLAFEEVPIFNTTGGYGNFILPGVLILILQQTMLLGMGMTAGTLREKYGRIILRDPRYKRVSQVITGRWLAYFLQYAFLAAYVLLVIPHIFKFVNIIYTPDLIALVLPYLLACIFFSMTTMSVVRQREDVMLIVVFTSLPLLFVAGLSWPGTSIPDMWKYIGYLFPSTFGIKAFVAMNSMGARISDVSTEVYALWGQVIFYLATTVLIYKKQMQR